MNVQNAILDEVLRIGFSECGALTPSDISFYNEIRTICAGNACQNYNKTWACPPAAGSIAQCRSTIMSYDRAYLFNAVYRLEDSFDFKGMRSAHREFKYLCDKLHYAIEEEYPKHLILSNEGCIRCKQCTYPNSPCRFPQMLFPAIEGFGLNVSELAKQAKIHYHNGAGTVTYFGMLLVARSPCQHPLPERTLYETTL